MFTARRLRCLTCVCVCGTLQLMHIHNVDIRQMRVHAHKNGQTDAFFFFLFLQSILLKQQHPQILHVTMLQMRYSKTKRKTSTTVVVMAHT